MKLNKKHMQAIQMIIEGKRNEAIIKKLGVSNTSLWNWRQDPDFQAELERSRQRAIDNSRQILENAVEKASFVLTNLLDCGIPSVQLKAAKEIIDRFYGTPTQRQEITADVKQDVNFDTSVLEDQDTKDLLRELHSKLNPGS